MTETELIKQVNSLREELKDIHRIAEDRYQHIARQTEKIKDLQERLRKAHDIANQMLSLTNH